MSTKKLFMHTLVDKHRSALIRFLTRKLNDQQDAADVAQDAYLRIYDMDSPEKLENARAYLFQTASHLAIDRLRRKTLHTKYISRTENNTLDSNTPSIEQTVHAQQQLQLLTQAINELPDKCRQAFVMQRKHGKSYSEIASAMEVSVSSVEKYISHALKHCYRRLR